VSPAVDVDSLEPQKEKSDITSGNCGLCRPSYIAWLSICMHKEIVTCRYAWFW